MNFRNAANSTFDFSTLHTKLPQDRLRTMLHKLKDLCFDGGENNLILLNYFVASRVKKKINDQLYFSKQDMKDAVNRIPGYIIRRIRIAQGKWQ